MRKILFIFALFCLVQLQAQDSITSNPSNWEVGGYVKWLGTFNHFNKRFLPPFLPADLVPGSFEDYQFHNRIDIKYYNNSGFSAGLGMRNRLFWGYRVQKDPTFVNYLDKDLGYFDLSFFYWKEGDALLHTIFDRAWAQYEGSNWSIRAGRQRINWGINTVWNPNDIFNQYNYLDFDYEERPGSDAVRIQFYPNYTSTIEFAYSPAKKANQSVAAALYKFNKWNYDIQFISGYYKRDWVIGAGWAGNLKNAGFKGEASYFAPLTDSTTANFTFSTSIDYQFSNGIYAMISYLYNDAGDNNLNIIDWAGANVTTQDSKNIFFFKHTIFGSTQYALTPLINGSMAVMTTPDFSSFIFIPSLTYSVTEDLDAMLMMQYFAAENSVTTGEIDWMSAAIFARLKYSF